MKELVVKIGMAFLKVYRVLKEELHNAFRGEQMIMKQARKASNQAKHTQSQVPKNLGKFTEEDWKDLTLSVEANIKAFPQIRLGQSYFNCLYMKRPRLAEQVRGTNCDPFYLDENIGRFKEFLLNN